MVNKCETIYFIIPISDKRLSSFFISLILSLFSYLYLLFPYLFHFNFVVSEQNVHIFLPTYLGGNFSPLLDIPERNFFPCGGRGVHVHPVPPPPPHPAYAPVFSVTNSPTYIKYIKMFRRNMTARAKVDRQRIA